eukprot:594328-Prymnesium_polylepis.1
MLIIQRRLYRQNRTTQDLKEALERSELMCATLNNRLCQESERTKKVSEIWRLISNGSEDLLRSVTELKELMDRGDSLIPRIQGSRGRDGRGGRRHDASMEDGTFESEARVFIYQPTCQNACSTAPIFISLRRH